MAHSFADHFSRVATDYASYRPRYPEALFTWLAGLPARRELAWDCGAGSGQATIGLLPYFTRIVATDASAALLANDGESMGLVEVVSGLQAARASARPATGTNRCVVRIRFSLAGQGDPGGLM